MKKILKEIFNRYGTGGEVSIEKITWPLMAGEDPGFYEAIKDVIADPIDIFAKVFGLLILDDAAEAALDEMLEAAEQDSEDLSTYFWDREKFGMLATVNIPFKDHFTETGFRMTGPYHQEMIYFEDMDEFIRKAAEAVDYFEARDRASEAKNKGKG